MKSLPAFLAIAIAVALICTRGRGAAPPAAPASPNPFGSFGVVVAPPPAAQGWKRILEGGTGHVARWAHTGADGKADAVMALEMEPAKGRSADKYAADLAPKMNGKIAKDPIRLGGEPAIRVVGERQPGAPSEALLAQHGNYIYVISSFADTKEQMPRPAVDAMARGLKFVPLGDPSVYTSLRGEKFPIFDKFLIEPLDTMRPNPDPPEPGQIGVSTYNFAAGRPDFIMVVQSIPNPNKVTLELLQAQFPGKLNPAAKLTWSKQPTAGGATLPAVISSTFDANNGGITPPTKTRIALGLLPPDNEIVMIFFNYPATETKGVAAYEKASEAIVRSLQPIKK